MLCECQPSPELLSHDRVVFNRVNATVCPFQQIFWPNRRRPFRFVRMGDRVNHASFECRLPNFLPETLTHFETASIAPGEAKTESDFEAYIQQRLLQGSLNVYAEAHQQLDRILLPVVMRFADGNQLQAARFLGIARQTLRTKLRELGLHVTRSLETGDEFKGGGEE